MTYHVYADDGYESTHHSEQAARKAAARGSVRRRIDYTVIIPTGGYTGGGHGQLLATYRDGVDVERARP